MAFETASRAHANPMLGSLIFRTAFGAAEDNFGCQTFLRHCKTMPCLTATFHEASVYPLPHRLRYGPTFPSPSPHRDLADQLFGIAGIDLIKLNSWSLLRGDYRLLLFKMGRP